MRTGPATFTVRTDRFKGRAGEAYRRRCAYRWSRRLAEGMPF